MKKACLIALLLPAFAFAAKPKFEIPEGAYTSRARCTTEKSTRRAQGNGWTDWFNEKDSEAFHFTFWNTQAAVNTLEDRGRHLKFTEIKTLSENDFEVKRAEKVEEWTYRDNDWAKYAYTLDITIRRRKGSPNLRLEKWEDGRIFQWEASAQNGVVTRNLLNPEILNTKERQFGLLRTVCRH
jgi:hypothetical protein